MTHIPRLFCFCGGEMRNEQMGVIVEVSLPNQDNAPYYKISADRHKCVDCDTQVFIPAREPLAEHYQERYDRIKTQYNARLKN